MGYLIFIAMIFGIISIVAALGYEIVDWKDDGLSDIYVEIKLILFRICLVSMIIFGILFTTDMILGLSLFD